MSQIVTVQQIDFALLTTSHEKVRVRSTAYGIREHHGAAGAKVLVDTVESSVIVRGKIIDHVESVGRREPYETFAQTIGIRIRVVGVKRAVAGFKIHVPIAINGGGLSALPDTVKAAIRAGVVSSGERESRSVVAQHPAVVWPVVAVGGKSDVNDSI